MIAPGPANYNAYPESSDLFLPRSGFGVYSIDRHVSIEKYNILWFKGIAT